jgi:glycosyltransferase involved in cell wall biosynthesis
MVDCELNRGIGIRTGPVDVSVVTPSFNMLDYLQRCCSSVADQENVRHEHIIMDGGSTDQTTEWLRSHPSLVSESQHDNGMYDALTKGFRIARGEIISHLNCDEQYLPKTLHFVTTYFQEHPDVDVLFGDALIVRPDGSLIAYRKCYRPIEPVILTSPLPVFTAAMFLRRRVVERGHFYDSSYKDIGDVEFILRLLRAGFRMKHVRRYMSTFTVTGYNRSIGTTTIPEEVRRLHQRSPWWVRRFQPAWRCVGYGMKLTTGAYLENKQIDYSIYASSDAISRTRFLVGNASFRWSWQ